MIRKKKNQKDNWKMNLHLGLDEVYRDWNVVA